MSEPHVSQTETAPGSSEEMNSALFAHLVMQQSNMALMLMGKAAHPEGKAVRDLEAAKLFIDLLEMLEAKTKGNLSKEESALLKQTLMAVRLSFVEAVEAAPAETQGETEKAPAEASKAAEPAKAPAPSSAAEEEEHRTKFSKKY